MDLSKIHLGTIKDLYDSNNSTAESLELDLVRTITKSGKLKYVISYLGKVEYQEEFDVTFLPYTFAEREYNIEHALKQIQYDRNVKSSVAARFNYPESPFKGNKNHGSKKKGDNNSNWAERRTKQ